MSENQRKPNKNILPLGATLSSKKQFEQGACFQNSLRTDSIFKNAAESFFKVSLFSRAVPKGRMFLIGVRSFSDKFEFYTRNHSHKQSSLLDTIFNYIFYFGAPGKYLHLSPKTRPTDSRFSRLFYRHVPGGPKFKM